MIRRVHDITTTPAGEIDWTKFEIGDAFEGTYNGHTGVFLRIPSGLVLLEGTQDKEHGKASGVRNWVGTAGVGPCIARMFRRVDIDFTTR